MRKAIGLDKLTMGVCYYPEHWPETLWADDLARMQKAGIEAIRIAEFAWSKFEPEEGHFIFDFFDRFLRAVEKTPVKVIFCTPTATPPAWLTEKYPEVLNATEEGVLLRHGMRRHYTYNSEVYREKTRLLVYKLAEHYGQHPSIIGWQIDNELNCVTDEFYSAADHAAFRDYLKEKYLSLEELNERWGCVFWNQEYTAWEEVFLPRPTGRKNSSNPHMVLEAKRFFSWSARRYTKLQYDTLRLFIPPQVYITTNGIFGHIDYQQMQDEGGIDFIMYDSYPSFGYTAAANPHTTAMLDRKWSMNLAKVRAISPQFGIMEQQSGPGGWVSYHKLPTPKPGQDRLWTFQSIAHGADFISYFRWRTCTFGMEMYWYGILDYDNLDNRRLEEIVRTRKDMEKIEEAAGSAYQAEVAVLFDYDNDWDGEYDVWHGPLRNVSNSNWFTALQFTHTPFDYVKMDESLSLDTLKEYKLLIYPHATIVSEHMAALLHEYVDGGGNLVMGARSGYKDTDGKCPMRETPGLLADLFGVTVNDFTVLTEHDAPAAALWGQEEIPMPLFNDVLTPRADTCRVLAAYKSNYYAGQPAITENRYGQGKAYYLGAAFSVKAAERLLSALSLDEPLRRYAELPTCCEAAIRRKGENGYLFILNYSKEQTKIKLNTPLLNLLTDNIEEGSVFLDKYGVAVFKLDF